MTTIQEAIEQGTSVLAEEGQLYARLDTQLLLSHVLDTERVTLYAHPQRLLTLEQEQQFLELVARRQQGEPVAYLVGYKEFYGLDFLVDRRVLIPRPETELLVDAALKFVRTMLVGGHTPEVADIGTGSGAIPITLAVQEPRLPSLYAVDISTDALEVARLNCQLHGVEKRVHLLQGDLLAPLSGPVDLLIANLPYVGTNELELLTPDVVNYEPHLALFSGPQGLDLLIRLFTEAQRSGKLKKHALLLLEIGYQQREPLVQILAELWPQATVTFEKDYAGWNRLLKIRI